VNYYGGNTAVASLSGLSDGTTYTVSITINGSTTTRTVSTDSYPVFDWDSTIEVGAEMTVVDNLTVAPVTAVEWNRLVDLVNLKTGSSHAHVAKGASFSAVDGMPVKKIANALNVSVSSTDCISAEFFKKLKNAVNAL